MSWSIENGNSHKCAICGSIFYDSDGGCCCEDEDIEVDENENIDAEIDARDCENYDY